MNKLTKVSIVSNERVNFNITGYKIDEAECTNKNSYPKITHELRNIHLELELSLFEKFVFTHICFQQIATKSSFFEGH